MPIPDTIPILGIPWDDVLFVILGGTMLLSALLVVPLRDIIRCGLAMMVCFGALAGLYVIIGAPLVAAAQVLVYIGAISVLILFAIMPLVVAIGAAILVLIVDLILPGRDSLAVAVSLIGLAAVAIATLWANQTPGQAYGGAYEVDALTTFLDLLFVSIIALTLVFAPDYLKPRGLPVAEFAVVLMSS